MPEGDSLHKLARKLRPLLAGAPVTRVATELHGRAHTYEDDRVTTVDAYGKHLVIAFESGRFLRVHLGMNGRFWRVAPGQPVQTPPHLLSVRLDTPNDTVVCSRAAEVAWTSQAGLELTLRERIGPDLLAPEVDLAAIVARARQRRLPTDEIAPVLLDQRVAAGIGNVYKAEVLFIERVNPWQPLGSLDAAALGALYQRSRELLQSNIGRGPRITTDADIGLEPDGRRLRTAPGAAGRLWVYGRRGDPCWRCRTRIRSKRQGGEARTTWWCPACQPLVGATA